MKKFPKPWRRPSRGAWYVTLDGRQVNLGPDKDAAFAKYHELMAAPRKRVVATGAVVELIDEYLGWVQKHRADATYVWYQQVLQLFARTYPDLLAKDLRPFHVRRWADSYADLASGTKRNYCRCIQRCMRWAEEEGLIDRSPITFLKKPAAGVRETVIQPEEFQTILQAIKRQPFRDVVEFCWETGARSRECIAIEARHVDLANHRVVFPVEESKMKRAPRVIFLTERAEAILLPLIGEGKLFRNFEGNPERQSR